MEAFGVARARSESARQLQKAQEILRFLESEFGPYPYDSLRLAMIEGRTPGGHSPPGMIVLAQRPLLLRGALKDDPASFADVPGFFLAHELAHQWWGQGVAGENYRERWLSEGMAQYAAALWTRHSLGESAFRGVLGRLGRWAAAESEHGPINLGYRLGHIEGDPQVYRAIVYNKGALILHMLRGIVGDEAFRKALNDFQNAHHFAKAGSKDLQQALEAASGQDLSRYFEAWVYGTSLPELTVTSKLEVAPSPHAVVGVAVRDLPGPVPLLISVTHEAGTESRVVSLGPEGGTFTIDTPTAPRKVEVNADRRLLARVRR
jgi:aminopeptidase N